MLLACHQSNFKITYPYNTQWNHDLAVLEEVPKGCTTESQLKDKLNCNKFCHYLTWNARLCEGRLCEGIRRWANLRKDN